MTLKVKNPSKKGNPQGKEIQKGTQKQSNASLQGKNPQSSKKKRGGFWYPPAEKREKKKISSARKSALNKFGGDNARVKLRQKKRAKFVKNYKGALQNYKRPTGKGVLFKGGESFYKSGNWRAQTKDMGGGVKGGG